MENQEINQNNTEEESELEEITEEVPAPRKRGRQKGVKIGPRATIWVCAAVIKDELIQECYSSVDNSSEEEGIFSEDDARDAFEDKHGCDPDSVCGPFHDKKGGMSAPSKKRETVSIIAPKLTSNREEATYRGWKGVAYEIENRKDAVFFMFNEEINPNSEKKKPIPPAKAILRTALEFTNVME